MWIFLVPVDLPGTPEEWGSSSRARGMSGLISGFSWLRYFHLGISPKFGEPTEVAHTVYQTTFYDFYGFYEFSLYDFYGLVYAADADDSNGVNDVSEPPWRRRRSRSRSFAWWRWLPPWALRRAERA
ncbi:cadherin-like domain-containing protein [Pseudoscourfieldia marina]